jgi:PEGA domain-containing protein
LMGEPVLETFAPDAPKNAQKKTVDAAPKFAVDPTMAEGGPARVSTSFSEMTELPPLKEIYIAPPPPPQSEEPAATPSHTVFHESMEAEEKPKIQPREVAEKAIKEIKNVPPRLLLYSIAGAAVLILIIAIGLVVHVHNLNGDDDMGAARPSAAVEAPAQPVVSKPAPAIPAPVETAEEAPGPAKAPASAAALAAKTKGAKKKVVAAVPAPVVIIPGQMAVDSTPQGAQVQVDGKSDPSWVTPFSLASLQPGQHAITVSKSGYSTDTRSVDVASGNRASVIVHLAQLMATLAVTSDPTGANVYVDGKDMGKTTPAQVSVDKGQHVVLVRKAGYIDETSTAQFALGQTVSISPTLRALGNADSIKTVGKMKKLFGGSGSLPGQATVSIHTQPKGAQVAVNQHMLEKTSPVDVALDPGNYVIDVTLSGYAPIHKVVTADKGGKVVVDEVLQRQ